MNRRTFFTSGGATSVVIAAGLGSSRRAISQTPTPYDPNILKGATATHASVIGNAFNGNGQPGDFYQLANAQAAVASSFIQCGFDAQYKSYISSITANQLNISANDYSKVLQAIQAYAPSFQASDLATLQNDLHVDPSQTAAMLADLQQDGLVSRIQASIPRYNALGDALVNLANGGGNGEPSPMSILQRPFLRAHGQPVSYDGNKSTHRSATYDRRSDRPHLRRTEWQRAMLTMGTGASGGGTLPQTGYSCAEDTLAGLAYGVAIATVSVMCYLTVVGAPICTAGLLVWASTAGTAWGFGHVVKCGLG